MRGKWVKGFVTATVLLVASTTPAYAAWTPATTTLATSSAYPGVQVEVVPVTGYTGGSAGVWLQTSRYLQGAMDVAAQVAWNATGWSISGITAPKTGEVYYQVVAVKINGVVYGSPISTGTWVTANATGYTDQPAPKNPPTQPTSTSTTSTSTTVTTQSAPAAIITTNGDGTYAVDNVPPPSSKGTWVNITNGSGQVIGRQEVVPPTSAGGAIQADVGGTYKVIPGSDCVAPDVIAHEVIPGTGTTESVCVIPQTPSETTAQIEQQQAHAIPPFVGTDGQYCAGGIRNGRLIPSNIAYGAGNTQANIAAWCTA